MYLLSEIELSLIVHLERTLNILKKKRKTVVRQIVLNCDMHSLQKAQTGCCITCLFKGVLLCWENYIQCVSTNTGGVEEHADKIQAAPPATRKEMWEYDEDPQTDPGEQVMWPTWLHIVHTLCHGYLDFSKLCIKQEEARQTKDYCESIVTSVIDSLQRHYLSVRELIGAQEQAVTAQVQTTLQTLLAEMEETKKRDAELTRLAQTESDVCFLQASELMYNLSKVVL